MSARSAIETPAVVVRLVDYGEADRIVGLYTRDLGLVSAIARSARRSQKRFAGTLQTGHHLVVQLVPGRGDGLGRLESARLVDAHLGLTTDLARLEEAAVVLRSVREHLPEAEPDEAVFDALAAHLASVSVEGASATRLSRFRLGLFDHLGVGPELEHCVRCGRPAPADRPAGFDPRLGGLVCRACGGSALVLSPEARTLARVLRDRGPDDPAAVSAALELGRALDALATVHLARRGPNPDPA